MWLRQMTGLWLFAVAGLCYQPSAQSLEGEHNAVVTTGSIVAGDTGKAGMITADSVDQAPFPLLRADTVDGVVFSTSTDKSLYKNGDSIRVRFRIKNRSMGTVLYDFNTTCQYDLRIEGSRGGILYSLLQREACRGTPSRLELPPSIETVRDFPPVFLQLKRTDTLFVKAQMAGYPLSMVPLRIVYKAAGESVAPEALEGATGHKPVLEFNHETRMLIIHLDRAQRLTISAFVSTGKKANKLTTEKFLEPGTHLISFNNKKLADGVVIFKIEGNGFSETKTINLSH
jgi:hypothetical protein